MCAFCFSGVVIAITRRVIGQRITNGIHCQVAWILYPICHTLPSMAKKLIALRVKQKDLKALERIAKREEEPVSETIRRAIAAFLKKEAR
jgi:Ribbon-helix-helix protein, copG family